MVDFTELLAGNGQFEVLFLTGHDGNPVCILAPESLPENFIVRRSDAPVTEKPVELRRTMSVTVRREGADSTKLDEGGIEWIIKSLLERQRSLKKARQRELEENEKEQLDIGEKLEEDGSDTVFNDTSNIATSVVDSTSPLVQLMDDSIAPEVGPMPNFSLLTGESRDYLVESPATENTLEEAFSQYENWRIEIPALPTCKNGCSNYHCEQAKSTTQVEYGPIMRPTKLAPLITTDLENSEDAYRKAFIQDEGILSIGRLSRSKTASPVPSADTATTTPTTTRAESNIRDIISTIQVKEMEKVPLLCMDPTRGSTMSSIDIIADELDLKSQILLDLVRGSESDAGSSPICQTTTQEFTIMENLKDEAAILETSIEDIAVSPTVSLESGTKVMKDIICKFFNSKSGCARGTSCIYRHQTTSSNDRPSRATTETSLDAATPVNSETSIDGAVIAKEVPKPKGGLSASKYAPAATFKLNKPSAIKELSTGATKRLVEEATKEPTQDFTKDIRLVPSASNPPPLDENCDAGLSTPDSTPGTPETHTIPDMLRPPVGVKKWCSFFFQYGKCAYMQTGCRFSHDQPPAGIDIFSEYYGREAETPPVETVQYSRKQRGLTAREARLIIGAKERDLKRAAKGTSSSKRSGSTSRAKSQSSKIAKSERRTSTDREKERGRKLSSTSDSSATAIQKEKGSEKEKDKESSQAAVEETNNVMDTPLLLPGLNDETDPQLTDMMTFESLLGL